MKAYAQPGENFAEAVKRVQNEMNYGTDEVILNFNDIPVVVNRDSLIYDLATIYDLRCRIIQLNRELK
jgi:hypothetical protein